MTLAQSLAQWADRLRDISAVGLHFARNLHDREHFRMVQDIAMEMTALAAGQTVDELEPLRGTLFARPTPCATGDGAVITAAGEILLVRRADNGLWAMPGGALMVGETAAEGVVREIREETGVRCAPVGLAGIFDSRLCGTRSAFHLYQLTFLCRPLPGPGDPPSHAVEVLEHAWFAEDCLPATLDPGHVTRIPLAFRYWRGEIGTYFDYPSARTA